MALDRLHLRRVRRKRTAHIRARNAKVVRVALENTREWLNSGGRITTDDVLPVVRVDYDGSDLNQLVKRLTKQVLDEIGIPKPWLTACSPR